MNPTELLILGVHHLDANPDASLCEEAIRLLAKWRPDAVAVEQMPGEMIDSFLRLGSPYDAHGRAQRAAEAVASRHSWGLIEARRVALDDSAHVVDRVVAWCAAFEPMNAYLLGRDADLPEEVRELVDTLGGTEVQAVAGEVARRVGLTRLYAFDDHTEAELFDGIPRDDIVAVFDENRPLTQPYIVQLEERIAAATAAGSYWPAWKASSSQPAIQQSQQLESGFFLEATQNPDLARRMLASWRTRNLHMAARLRAVTGRYPGQRVLAIVGLAHIGPLRSALGVDQWDLRLVDVDELG